MTDVNPLAHFDLSGKNAVVTGASSGLGWRFTQVLAAAGARVVATARRADRLDELVATNPESIVAVAADVSIAADRERLLSEAESALGPVDILVNNAGISDPKAIEKETLDEFTMTLEVNLVSVWHLCKLFGTPMAERGNGSIVNVASILGLVGGTPLKQASYAASKGGVVNLTRELGLQWARKGVRVNSLCPGWFETEMTEEMGEPSGMAFVQSNSPMPRMAVPSELDGPLLLLASDAGSFMTGSAVVVDGGWTAR